ncbi:magnesium/cobalt transporter CorA [Trinickia caryophylli]|uniref:Magnesium transport protein CorA n=1 Tax=Trinickia caryophylli TaxID=28094 RepID=A0A1X7G7I1_TRICW|nr:magnesium/cobalt transporter CorA [Trinickia caryophylli]PMS11449.1 magnesium and cobalt transport protein CorA [Trinickia caryophylli]TRX17648.1 magnesium/cobalt transporter CorA [Trinickia caryophylli]WQE11595.1 magnesium/cobalt transporter CorA [Trinickia caryophylli]SMF65347.1 magnesium transporter [Trinickia caryophylli]GLU34771.1 magnesium transporter CorA [Trinickia caryophylli]
MDMVVNSVIYQAGKRLRDIDIDEISDVVNEPNTFVWVGLRHPDETLLRKVQEEFHLHDLAIEDALKAHQRPKLEVYGESLFIVVKTVQLVDGEVQYGETHLFVGRNFLVTVRHGASSSYKEVRARVEQNPALLAKGPGFALYSVLDFVVDNYQPIMSSYEAQFDRLESEMFKADFDLAAMQESYELRRSLMELRSAAMPVEEICNQLVRFHEEIIPKELRAYLRDVQDHAHRVITSSDDLREMLTNAMHVNLALVSVRQNDIVKQLAGWGAVLAVPTVVFSLYGMNFQNMPELKLAWGYPVTLAITVGGCVWLYRKLKKTGWL